MHPSITLGQLTTYLDTLLDVQRFDEKAYNGLQVANNAPIKKVATAVTISKEVIAQAIKQDAQAIVVHHGIFRKGDAHPVVGRLYDYLQALITHNIALLGYHLPLDAHQEVGNNWRAAHDLGLTNCKPFCSLGNAHIGVIGQIETTSFYAFKKKVEAYYGREAHAVKIHDDVRTVGIISGGADAFIKEAAHAGADCFITGRVDERVWDDAHEYGVSFLGLGHYGTETVGPKALADAISNEFGIPTVFLKTNNPF